MLEYFVGEQNIVNYITRQQAFENYDVFRITKALSMLMTINFLDVFHMLILSNYTLLSACPLLHFN